MNLFDLLNVSKIMGSPKIFGGLAADPPSLPAVWDCRSGTPLMLTSQNLPKHTDWMKMWRTWYLLIEHATYNQFLRSISTIISNLGKSHNWKEHHSGGLPGSLFCSTLPDSELCSGWGISDTTNLKSVPASELVEGEWLTLISSSMANTTFIITRDN